MPVVLLDSLEGWLKAHAVFLPKQREGLVAAKAVKKELAKSATRTLDTQFDAETFARLEGLFRFRDEEDGLAARAQNVAFDWITFGLPPSHAIFNSGNMPSAEYAQGCLQAALKSANTFAELKISIATQQAHFDQPEDQQRQRLEQFNGRLLPNSTPFKYQPDPRQRRHARPVQATYDILAAALRDIYKCTGRPAHVPRDDSPTSPFLRFLDAARLSLPKGHQSDLVSPARRAAADEQARGPGTLERFQAKLYHPDCWRT